MKTSLVERACALSKALSEIPRMKMMKILGSNAENSLTVSQIAEILGISQPTATKHLQILHSVSLVKRQREARCIFYSVNVDTVKELKISENSFIKAFTPCPYNYDCDNCPQAETCI
jgi:DNA-binding transcriptional ArsR family regulator